MKPFVLIWGGGDLASGVAIRLHRVGILVFVVETAQPTAVRRSVAFAQAVYDGETTIEGTVGRLIAYPEEMISCWKEGAVPVMVDPELELISVFKPLVLVDGRMRKTREVLSLDMAQLVVGLGPGFTAVRTAMQRLKRIEDIFWVGFTGRAVRKQIPAFRGRSRLYSERCYMPRLMVLFRPWLILVIMCSQVTRC